MPLLCLHLLLAVSAAAPATDNVPATSRVLNFSCSSFRSQLPSFLFVQFQLFIFFFFFLCRCLFFVAAAANAEFSFQTFTLFTQCAIITHASSVRVCLYVFACYDCVVAVFFNFMWFPPLCYSTPHPVAHSKNHIFLLFWLSCVAAELVFELDCDSIVVECLCWSFRRKTSTYLKPYRKVTQYVP